MISSFKGLKYVIPFRSAHRDKPNARRVALDVNHMNDGIEPMLRRPFAWARGELEFHVDCLLGFDQV
jgi:hypothetical protein